MLFKRRTFFHYVLRLGTEEQRKHTSLGLDMCLFHLQLQVWAGLASDLGQNNNLFLGKSKKTSKNSKKKTQIKEKKNKKKAKPNPNHTHIIKQTNKNQPQTDKHKSTQNSSSFTFALFCIVLPALKETGLQQYNCNAPQSNVASLHHILQLKHW